MERNTISIVIPAYNASKSIIRCVDSVFSQTYPVKEVIVIDDGSLDDTYVKLKDYKEKHEIDILRIEKQINNGPSVARNRGIALATGEWIAFLDADDYWLKEKLALQVRCLDHDPDLCVIGCKSKIRRRQTYLVKVTFSKLLLKNYFVTSSVLVKRSILPMNPFDANKHYSEDYKLWLELSYSNKCAVLSEALVVYADNENMFTRNSLSARMWKMEKGELDNYKYCLYKGYINRCAYFCLIPFSLFKYLIRLFLRMVQKRINYV